MIKIIIILLISFSNLLVFGQSQKELDSLVRSLPTIKNDTLKARTYLKIAEKYFFIDVEKALYYDKLGLELAKKMNWERGIAVFNAGIGRAFSDKGNYDSSLYYYKKGLAINKKINDYWNMASTLNNLGALEANIKSDYIAATKYYFEALKVTEKIEDKYVQAVSLDNISNVYLFQKNYEKALEYGFKALNLRKKFKTVEKTNVTTGIELGNSYFTIANLYVEMGEYTKAKPFFESAIKEHKQAENKLGLAKAYSSLALTFGENYEKRIETGLLAKDLWDKVNPNNLEAINNMANLGKAYYEWAQKPWIKSEKAKHNELLKNAEKYILEAINLSKINGETAYKAMNLGYLAELQALKGDYKNAFLNLKIFKESEDSLYSQKAKNEIAGLETKREVEIRDKEIQLSKLALDSQKKQKIGYLVGLALLSVIGGLLFYQNQNRKKSNQKLQKLNEELDEANKLKARFFAILSHDLRSPVSNLINFLQLQKDAPELVTPEMKIRNELKIRNSAENLLENMESMLLWSKSQMEHFEPKIKKVSVDDLFDYLQKTATNYPNIQFHFENTENISLNTDEDYLKTILQNLNQNAIKALKNREDGCVIWKAKKVANKLEISILDNAGGMPQDEIDKFQNGTHDLGGKSGFGLQVVKDLAKKLDLQIEVKAIPNKGTEVVLWFID